MDMAVFDHLILVDKRKRCPRKLLSIRSEGSTIVLLVQIMVSFFIKSTYAFFGEICIGEIEPEKTLANVCNFDVLDFNKKKEEVLKETEAIFSDEDEVVDLEAELRQKLKDEKQSSFTLAEELHDDFEDLQGEDEIEFPPAPPAQQLRGRSKLRSDHVTKSHDLVKSHDNDFDDIGTSFALHETEPNLVKIEESKKKIMLWSNPSPFGSSINQPKIIRHVEAPKPKGYTPVPPTQKFSPAGNFSIKLGQPTRER